MSTTDATTSSALRLLLTGLVDDAAVFPPGLAPLDVAVREHHVHRRSWYAGMVGPLLCPADRAIELVEHLRDGDAPTPVTLVAPSAAAAIDAVEAMNAAGGMSADVEFAALELPLPFQGHPADTAAQIDRLVAWTAVHRPDCPPALWLEVPRGNDVRTALSLLAGGQGGQGGQEDREHPTGLVGAKLRVGGTTAQAFPDEREVAMFVQTATELGVRFKLTAGLHHAVRHTDPASGFEHHGFLNVICAVRAATVPGVRGTHLVDILAERDAAPLVDIARGMDVEDARRVRSTFASFGCCGVTDPVHDLVSLHLLAPGEEITP